MKAFKDRDPSSLSFLEIGAGHGRNLSFFNSVGIPPDNIYANELVEDRVAFLQNNYPFFHIIPGNVLDMDHNRFQFDIILISTVFSSILDRDFRKRLAKKAMDMLKPGGIIFCYDFAFNNPANKDVRKVVPGEIRQLYDNAASIQFKRVTMFPYLGRKVGKLYFLVNALFPFLRTHVISIIRK
jgi:SAM-dependent methyltransferase